MKNHVPNEDGEFCSVCFVDLETAKTEKGGNKCTGCTCDHDCRYDRYRHDKSCEHYSDCPLFKVKKKSSKKD